MGNQKFKLSDMIPNAWFYKLKDMNKSSKTSHTLNSSKLKKYHLPPPPAPPSSPPTVKTLPLPPNLEPQCQPRKSYHIKRELTTPPQQDLDSLLLVSPSRKSKSSTKSRKSSRRSSSLSSSCSCKSVATSKSSHSKSYSISPPSFAETDQGVGFFVEDALLNTDHTKQSILDIEDDLLKTGHAKQSILDNALPKAEHFDIDIDIDKNSLCNKVNTFSFQLPRINTKQEQKPRNFVKENKLVSPMIKEQRFSPPSRRFSVSSPGGVRLKINSPRMIGRKQGGNNGGRRSTSSKKRRSISESFAVVKSSYDPHRDFKESMVEMIVQNNLRGSKDLEDLLACYLSLNSDEYHDVIIKVFKQLWFDVRHHK